MYLAGLLWAIRDLIPEGIRQLWELLMRTEDLKSDLIVQGPLFPERVHVITVAPMGHFVQTFRADNRGFDLILRKPHPEDPQTAIDVRFIEVKGRAGVGEVALTSNEYHTAQRLKADYWLYVAFDCGGTPELCTIQDPARLGWEPIVVVEHYRVDARQILGTATGAKMDRTGEG